MVVYEMMERGANTNGEHSSMCKQSCWRVDAQQRAKCWASVVDGETQQKVRMRSAYGKIMAVVVDTGRVWGEHTSEKLQLLVVEVMEWLRMMEEPVER